ncbi:MAG: hypothetical protein NVSMB17_14130 [Candidatus Dormibacteria bacterium]
MSVHGADFRVPGAAPSGPATAAWPVRWRACWIWDHAPADINRLTRRTLVREERFVMFRYHFESVAPRRQARVRVTADGRYVAWLNGAELGRGPIRSEPGELYFDQIELSGKLRRGDNVFAVLVRHYGLPVPWWRPAPAFAGLGRGGLVLESDTIDALATGEGWRARRGPWSRTSRLPIGPPNEDFDGRNDPNWTDPGFDDSGWASAVVLSDAPLETHPASLPATPFTAVRANPLPALSGEVIEAAKGVVGRAAQPRRVPSPLPLDRIYRAARCAPATAVPCVLPRRLSPGEALRVDLGRIARGLVEVLVDAGEGAVVTLRGGEHLTEGIVDEPERQWAHRHACRAGTNLVKPFEALGLRHLEVGIAGAPVTVRAVRLREQLYPLSVDARFECDDPVLNAVWSAGVRTVAVCCTDAFLDCPGREQRAWTADAYLTGLLVRYLSADHRLADRALDMATRHRRVDGLLAMVAAGDYTAEPDTIPSASLHWTRALARGAELGLPADEVERLLPLSAGILARFMDHVVDGVLQPLPGWPFVEWWPVPMDVPNASMHGLLLMAVQDHVRVATRLGHRQEARRAGAAAQVLARGLRNFLAPGGDLVEHVGGDLRTQHAAALAVLTGVHRGRSARTHLARALDPGVARDAVLEGGALGRWVLPPDFDPQAHVLATQPFFSHFLHQALAVAGLHRELLASLRRWSQFLGTGDGTFWEHWVGAGGSRSHAHAWSATPTYDLLANVLGVTVHGAGKLVTVAPRPADLAWLTGAVATAHGPVSVECEASVTGLRGRVRLPPGVTGEVVSPAGLRRPLRSGASDLRW